MVVAKSFAELAGVVVFVSERSANNANKLLVKTRFQDREAAPRLHSTTAISQTEHDRACSY